MSEYNFDALIIGTGIAGLTSAIKLAEKGLNVAIVSREKNPNVANTHYAQGGIIYPQKNEAELIEDIMRASAGTANKRAAKILAARSGEILDEVLIQKVNTDFTRNENNELCYTKEAAHSRARIIFKGDYTGKSILDSMLSYVRDKNRFPNITFLTAHTAIDLLTPGHHGKRLQQRFEDTKVVGAYLLNQLTNDVVKAMAKVTILATGGIGALYLHHSNSRGARGDGHAMAKRAGAELINMEFVQFHPTTFFESSSHRRFLISEAVRGEGGKLVNSRGEHFMSRYHPEMELAPRDVVARAIADEAIRTGHDCVYLDISKKDSTWIKDRFPTIYKNCLASNIDITTTPIPVVPAAHYTCGGIKTDLSGRTSLKGLYAVGEVACTGLHGANRLASTALLEGLTWGYIAAEEIVSNIDNVKLYPNTGIKEWENVGKDSDDTALIHQDWLTLRQTMWNYVGLVRTKERLSRANAMFRELHDEVTRFYKNSIINDELIGLRNAVEVGYSVIDASIRNKESLGCFYRKN